MRLSRALEVTAWISGIALLATYVAVRTWSAHASDEGIEALRQARQQHSLLLAQNTQLAAPASSVPAARKLTTSQPDMSLWDSKRIAEYEATLAQKAMPESVLRIPKLKLEVPVYAGTSDMTLNRGAGLIEGTAAVESDSGNIGIAAHRDGFFRPLKDIQVGDRLFLDTVTATREYQVTRLDIVDPSDVSVLAPTEDSTITLVTCYPFYYVGSAPKRFIVRAQIKAD